jgi:hypothetical protein
MKSLAHALESVKWIYGRPLPDVACGACPVARVTTTDACLQSAKAALQALQQQGLYVAEAQLIFDIYTQLALHGWVLMLPGGGRNWGDGWNDKNPAETKWATYMDVDRSLP